MDIQLKEVDRKGASLPTVRRLPAYLHLVRSAWDEGMKVISGTVIANELGLEPIQVRKDLAVTGIVGKPRVGYNVLELIHALENFLRWNEKHKVVLVGAGSLGTALLGYPEFKRNGMEIVAAFDSNPEKVGKLINGTPVHSMDAIEEVFKNRDIEMIILCLPTEVAQQSAEKFFDKGIRAIWNFTNVKLKVPEGIKVQKEDLSSGYAVLSVRT
jgi:redox-sensing transcriptional repressor